MNRLYWYLRGYFCVMISGVSIDWVLNTLSASRVPFWGLKRTGDFTVKLNIFFRDLPALKQAAEASMCEISEQETLGIWEVIRTIIQRPVFLFGVILSVACILVSQNYLMFFGVSGSEKIPDAVILRELETLGIGFGTYGPDVKPKWIKDHILNVMPDLQWITVTQKGCKAQIVVRDRPVVPQITDRKGYANLVALKSGQVTDISIYAGQGIVQVGDYVSAGDMLVSGVVDLDRIYSVVHAQGEIYATTWADIQLVTPQQALIQEREDINTVAVWLEIGKRRIKIFGNSGISDGTCDKMINRRFLTLPGNHVLPIAVLIERYTPCMICDMQVDETAVCDELERFAEEMVASDLIAGEILERSSSLASGHGCHVLNAQFTCREMIAQTIEGKWNKEDFHND